MGIQWVKLKNSRDTPSRKTGLAAIFSHSYAKRMKHQQPGFTLIELLIALAIIGILSALMVPSYQHYTRKAHYTEIVQAVLPFKLAVEECYQVNGSLQDCQNGKNGIPHEILKGNGAGLVDSLTISNMGMITVTPKNLYGIKETDTYILTPQVDKNNQLTWMKQGGGIAAGYAK